jgi:hypothetical protein
MWRALFLALGVFTLVMGIEGLLIERFTINWNQDTPSQQVTDHTLSDWVPWSLMSAGTIVILYSFTLPKRLKST